MEPANKKVKHDPVSGEWFEDKLDNYGRSITSTITTRPMLEEISKNKSATQEQTADEERKIDTRKRRGIGGKKSRKNKKGSKKTTKKSKKTTKKQKRSKRKH